MRASTNHALRSARPRSKPDRRARSTLLAITVLAATSCTSDGSPSGRSPSRVTVGLCAAATAARAGDATEARRIFFDRAHDPLHELAAAVGEQDRSAAARLLEAKEAVEAGLETGGADLADDLDQLVVATGAALVANGDAQPEPCT